MDIVTLAASRKYTDKKIMESGAVGIKYEIVDSLPSSGKAQTIYFVKNNNSLINDYYDEYVWISSSSAFEKIGSTQIDGSTTQADWNQNDDTQPDYIKNRPFYTGGPVETVLVEETTASFFDIGDGAYAAQVASMFEAAPGETYKVSWDGAVYECTSFSTDDINIIAIGNTSIIGGHDTGEPFLIVINGEETLIAATDTSASHTFSISRIVEQIVKIDPKYLSISSKPEGKSYLTFSSPNKFILGLNGNTKQWDGTLEYFTSNDTWTIWDGTSNLSAITNGGEYVLYLRGTGNTVITGSGNGWSFNGTDIKCIGNIENLLDYATVKSGVHPGMSANCYYRLFSDCSSLTQAPDLPATMLATGCYQYMFSGCTSLTQAPALPATVLMNYCYQNMFSDCTSLTQAPALPATTLANSCYQNMFYGCTSLKLASTKTDEYIQEYRIPSSGNGVIRAGALDYMFKNTGGTFAGTPSINTTYYLSSDNMIVRDTELATLNGYVGSMINNAVLKSGALIVTITDNNGTLSADKSLNDIENAISAGTSVFVDYGGNYLPLISAADYAKYFGVIMCDETSVATVIIEITLNGEVNDISASVETLPNPNALNFTGAVTGSYDGSTAVTVNIPSAVTDDHINSLIDTRLGVIENGAY